uniref:Rab-GAP TBC domain-containing protein n=1 Tax=Strongyloides stercoralis TaxID=6248 RepID=A0A0K0E574_STRER
MELGYVGGMKELCWLNILLVCGNGLFVDDNISDQVIEMSRECLDVWYERRELISGTDGITMKAHLITHFHQIAKRFGNVCGYSYFYGEGLLYMLSWLISQKSENNLLNQVRIRLADYNMSSRVLTNKAIADYIMKSELATPIRSDSLDMTTTESDTLIMKSDNERKLITNWTSEIIKTQFEIIVVKGVWVSWP